MTTILNGAQSPLSFSPSQRVRITDLQTPHDDLSTRHVAAQVVLIWPYSSSTRRFSLLLSETDARPFKGRKQLKVTFLNGAARAAQDTHVGIGDEIRLQLEGCQWAETSDAIATPGKRVDGDIQFRRYLAFEILRDRGSSRQVCYEATGTPSPVTSPVVNGSLAELGALQDVQITTKRFSVPYSSPAVRKENRKSSGSYLDSPLDPFAEDKDYVYGRSRKRTKFARPSGDWKLIDDDEVELGTEVTELATPSKAPEPEMTREMDAADEVSGVVETQDAPEMVDLTSPIQETFDSAPVIIDIATSQPMRVAEDSGNDFIDESATLMKPPETPARPSKRQKPTYIDLEDRAEDSDATSTPRLMPMPSPGLPLVPPLIRNSGVDVGYFPSASELDATGQPEQEFTDEKRPSTSVASEPSSDDSLVIVDARSTPAPEPVPSGAIKADVVEDEDMYGASQPPQPLQPLQPVAELEIETPQRSRDALDVLEEFLQISPTLPEEPLGLKMDGNAADGDIDEAEPEASSQSDAESSDEESSQIPVERLTSPPQPQLAEVEHEQQERSAPSRSLSLDGAMDDDDRRPSPPASPDISFQIRQATPDTLPAASQQIQVEVKTVVDEAARSLRSHRNQLPPTPSNTQEAQPARDLVETEKIEVSLLPTPDNTQDREQLPSSQIVPSQDEIAVEETDSSMKAPNLEAEDTQATRCTSQRPSRKQIMTSDISSPYFTPRRPQKPPQSFPTKDKTPVPSSPPVEAPTSPTRPVTRSQRLTSKAPSLPPVADSHAEEVKTSPSVQTELTQDLPSKTGITTSISYYAPLASIDQHRDQLVDIIAVAVDESTKPLRAKSGPKDHYNMLRLADPSLDSKMRVTIQIFRPAREALPSTRRGDVVLLRSFKPQSVKHKFLLNSGSESAWAVFNANPTSRTMYDDVKISGPPVEYSGGETAQVKKLVQWWQTQGAEAFPVFGKKSTTETLTQTEQPLPEQSPSNDKEDILESVEPPPLSPGRTRRRNNRTDNINNEDDALSPDTGRDMTPTSTRHQPPRKAKSKTPAPAITNGTRASTPSHSQTTPVTRRNGSATPQAQKRHASAGSSSTPTEQKRGTSSTQKRASTPSNPLTGAKSTKSPTVVHELRDGTKYVDDGREKNGEVVHELRDGRNYVDE